MNLNLSPTEIYLEFVELSRKCSELPENTSIKKDWKIRNRYSDNQLCKHFRISLPKIFQMMILGLNLKGSLQIILTLLFGE